MRKQPQRVAIDIDSTTAETLPPVLEQLNREHGTNYTVDDVTEWNMKLPHPKGDIDYVKTLFRNLDNPDFLASAKPVEGAKEGVKRIRDAGNDVFYLTGRLEDKHGEGTQRWLDSFDPGAKVYYAPKGKHLMRDKFDVLLEDAPNEIRRIATSVGPGGKAVVFDRPWNRKHPTQRVVEGISPLVARRVADWKEAPEVIINRDYF